MDTQAEKDASSASVTLRPGEAWEIAVSALRNGNFDRATAMLPHMLISDRRLMEKRIAAAKAKAE